MSARRALLGTGARLIAAIGGAALVLVLTDAVAMRVDPSLRPSRYDLVRGAQIFTSRCQVCHARQLGDMSRVGPNLRNIGSDAATRRPPLTAVEYILESILTPGAFQVETHVGLLMPENLVTDLPDSDIRNLVAYVASLGARPDDAAIAKLEVKRGGQASRAKLPVRRAQMERGEALFRERCESCHSFHNGSEYVILAPAVFGVGHPDDPVLRESILHAREPVSEAYRSSSVTLRDGSTVIGHVVERTPGELVILSTRPESLGRVVTVRESDVEPHANGAPMVSEVGLPPGARDATRGLTPQDVDDLVALLKALN